MEDNDSGGGVKVPTGFLSWGNLRDVALLAFIAVVAYRLGTADIKIELKDFSFTDLLSLCLAVSAVALSAAFYFKADESASRFYNNTYKFTKDISESLGRIDAGFKEKLNSIDKSTDGLNDKFSMLTDPGYMAAKKRAAQEEEAKEAEIDEQEARRDDLLLDLARRADLAGEEKEQALSKLAEMSEELALSKAELERFRQSLKPETAAQLLKPYVYRSYPPHFTHAPAGAIARRFSSMIGNGRIEPGPLELLESLGVVSGDKLTPFGIQTVRDILASRLRD